MKHLQARLDPIGYGNAVEFITARVRAMTEAQAALVAAIEKAKARSVSLDDLHDDLVELRHQAETIGIMSDRVHDAISAAAVTDQIARVARQTEAQWKKALAAITVGYQPGYLRPQSILERRLAARQGA